VTWRNFICRLLARLGIYPKGCPARPSLGADKAKVNLKQKD